MVMVTGISLRSESVNERVPEEDRAYFGYVFVDGTRVGFNEQDGLWATRPEGYWPAPTLAQAKEAYRALQYESWGHKIPARYYDQAIALEEVTERG